MTSWKTIILQYNFHCLKKWIIAYISIYTTGKHKIMRINNKIKYTYQIEKSFCLRFVFFKNNYRCLLCGGPASSVRKALDYNSEDRGFAPRPRHITCEGIGHNIFSISILPLPLIQEWLPYECRSTLDYNLSLPAVMRKCKNKLRRCL